MYVTTGSSVDVRGVGYRLVSSYGCREVPDAILKIPDPVFLEVPGKGKDVEYCVVAAYAKGSFSDQVSVLIPITRMMPGNLGAKCCVGCGTRYVDTIVLTESIEHTPELLNNLIKTDYVGYVCWAYDSEHNFLWAIKGVPFYGMYSLLATLSPDLLVPWLENPLTVHFSETWATALAVSRYPWPYEKKTKLETMVDIEALSGKRHWWRLDTEQSAGKLYETCDTILGVATGFSPDTLSVACEYTLMTAQAISVEDKQYRIDLMPAIADTWGLIQDRFGPLTRRRSLYRK